MGVVLAADITTGSIAPSRLGPGDLVTVPPDAPHTVQLLSAHVRLVDTLYPLREDFLP